MLSLAEASVPRSPGMPPLSDDAPGGPVLGRHKMRLKLRDMRAINGGLVRISTDGLDVETAQPPWTYSAFLRLSDDIRGTGPASLEVELQVIQGEVGLQVAERGSTVFLLDDEKSVTAEMGRCTLRFALAAMEEAGDLFVRGWPHDEGAARATIFRITLLADRPLGSLAERLMAAVGV
jgi:hypothetical protein